MKDSLALARRALAAFIAVLVAGQSTAEAMAAPARPTSPSIAIVQDIHAHAEAQRSIADALDRLREAARGPFVVGVEGAAGPFDFSPYRAFPGDRLRAEVAGDLLDEGRIGAPVFAALRSDGHRLAGVESPALYVANVEAYRRAAPRQAALTETVERARAALAARKAAAFTPALARFDAAVAEYRAGRASLGEHLEALVAAGGEGGLAIDVFLAARRMERGIDFPRVEREKRRFLERLVGALDEDELDDARRWVLSAASEGAGAGRRFDYLFHAARAKGISPRAFPALDDYARYLRLADAVDAGALFEQAAALERVAYERLCAGAPGAAALVAADRRLHLAAKLIGFALTRDEWDAYKAARPAGAPEGLPADALADFEDFYRVAEQRDAALARNALAQGVRAVVAGGFHTDGLASAFRSAGASVEIVRPKITSAAPERATAYLSVFAAKKTPLERLFARWKLFLAPPAVIGVPAPLVSSANDDAPQAFVDHYRRRTTGDPALAAAVASAARALAESRGESRLFGQTIERLRAARPSLRWLSETVGHLGPLAGGLAAADPLLIGAGLAAGILLLPAAHARVDGESFGERWAGRAAWASLFTGVYLVSFAWLAAVGVPAPLAAVAALAVPAAAHRLNHHALRRPGSPAGRFFFGRLGLPRLLMSTGGFQFSPRQLKIIAELTPAASEAIKAWRAQPDKTNPNVENDPVLAFWQTIHDRMERANDPEEMMAASGAFVNALLAARLNAVEVEARIRRDQIWCITRGIDITGAAEAVNNQLIPTAYISYGTFHIVAAPAVARAVRDGANVSMSEAFRRMMTRAIGDWRAAGSAAGDADLQIRRVWAYLRNFVRSGRPESVAYYMNGAFEALRGAHFKPAELERRAMVDVADEISDVSAAAVLYPRLASEYAGRRDTATAAALAKGVKEAARYYARQMSAQALLDWIEADTPEESSQTSEQILKLLAAAFNGRADSTPEWELAVAGFAESYAALASVPDDVARRAWEDFGFAGAMWRESGYKDAGVLRGIIAVYRRLEQTAGLDAAVVRAAVEDAWYKMMRRHAGIAFALETRGSPPAGARIYDLPGIFTSFAASNGLGMTEGPLALAGGLVDAEVSGEEGAAWVKEALGRAMVGPPTAEGMAALGLVYQAARSLGVSLHGRAQTSVTKALAEIMDVPALLARRTHRGLWPGRGEQAADENTVAEAMSRLPAVDVLGGGDGAVYEKTVDALIAADLTPEQLRARASRHVIEAARRFLGRPVPPEMSDWSNPVMDPGLDALAVVYLELARRYKAAGDDARNLAILSGLSEASASVASTDLDESHALGFLRFPNLVAYACIRDDAYDLAIDAASVVDYLSFPGYEMPQISAWVHDVIGEAYRQLGRHALGMRNGFEFVTLAAWRDVVENVHHLDQAAALIDRMCEAAKSLLLSGSAEPARIYAARALEMLDRRPDLRAAVAPTLPGRLLGIQAAARMQITRDPAELPALIVEGLSALAPLINGGDLDSSERGPLIAIVYEMEIEACRTGNIEHLDGMRRITDVFYAGEEYRRMRVSNELRAVLLLATSPNPPPLDRLRAIVEEHRAVEDPRSVDLRTSNDATYVTGFAMADAVLGRLEAGREQIEQVVHELGLPEVRERMEPATADRARAVAQLELAALLSMSGAPAAAIAPLIAQGVSAEVADERSILNYQRVVPRTANAPLMLDAVELILSAPEKTGEPLAVRVDAATFARTLAPADIGARLERLGKKSKAVVRAVKERFELIDAMASTPWPGREFVLFRHGGEMAYHERLYRTILRTNGKGKGAQGWDDFERSWRAYRKEMHHYAAGLANVGMVEESLAVLKAARKMAIEAAKAIHPPQASGVQPEDAGIVAFPHAARAPRVVLREALQTLQNADPAKLRLHGRAVAVAAESAPELFEAKSEREATSFVDTVVRFLDKFQDPAGRPGIELAQARLNARLGRWARAREILERVANGERPEPGAQASRAAARLELARASFIDASLVIGQRITDADRLAAAARETPGVNTVEAAALDLVVSMFQFDPADAAAAARIAEQCLKAAQAAAEAGAMSDLLRSGFAARVAELALSVGPGGAPSFLRLLDALAPWSGERGGASVRFAGALAAHLASDPRGFLGWLAGEGAKQVPFAEANAWRVAAAVRTGDRGLIRDALVASASRPAGVPEAYWQGANLSELMRSPLLRRAYLDAAAAVLTQFSADEWAKEKESLGRVIETVSSLGDPDIVYLLDALAENKAFPARDVIHRHEGPMFRLERQLTVDGWVERIIRMDVLNPGKSAQLRDVSQKRLPGTLDEIDAKLQERRFGPAARAQVRAAVDASRGHGARRDWDAARAALNAVPLPLRNGDVAAAHADLDRLEAEWEAEKARSAAALAAAQEAYSRLEFDAALAELNSIHPDLAGDEAAALGERLAEMTAVWRLYLKNDFEGALRRLQASVVKDAVPIQLRRRIEGVRQAAELLASRRPQQAQIKLDSMNSGITVDPVHEALRRRVVEAHAAAEARLRELREVARGANGNAAAIARVRASARAVFDIDEEYETVMHFLVEKAQVFYDRRDYKAAQDMLGVLVDEAKIFDPAAENHGKFNGVRVKLERLRSLARAQEMRAWLTQVDRVLRTKLEAEANALERSALRNGGTESALRGMTFTFPAWSLDRHGYVIVDKIFELRTDDGRPARYGAEGAVAVPLPVAEAPFQSNVNFQLTFGAGDEQVRLPVSFVRKIAAGEGRLLFLPDATAGDTLRRLESQGLEGRLNYLEDISTLTQVRAVEETLGYIDRHIQALTDDRAPPNTLPVVGRLLGLVMTPQGRSGPADESSVSSKFAEDPAQLAAILGTVDSGTEASAIQGPPGTGKSTTAVEIARLLARPRGKDRPGRIIVVTAQAHAGVDTMARKLRDANVPIVRSASGGSRRGGRPLEQDRNGRVILDGAQRRVTRSLQMTERERLEALMNAIETHYATGLGFAYCVTNNGLRGDRKVFDLLTLYLNGEEMGEIRLRFANYTREPGAPPLDREKLGGEANGNGRRSKIRPVWMQEEAGQANVAEALAIPFAVDPDVAVQFGDQDQLEPSKLDDRSERLIRQEVDAGLRPSAGPLNVVLSAAAKLSLQVSLFEEAYAYAVRWAALAAGRGAGIFTSFLNLARRGHWLITAAVVNVYYADRLRHRDEHKPRNRWEKIKKDTIVFVDSDGREEADGRDREVGDEEDPVGRSPSKRNFREVGEVVRAVTYHLNSRSARNGNRRKAGDILILTPYKAQNALINETLRWLAIANDFARREAVGSAELREMGDILMSHATQSRANRVNVGDLRRLLSSLKGLSPQRRAGAIDHLLQVVGPMYDLAFDASRQIGRQDLPEVEVETPDEDDASEPAAPAEDESLDEQEADVIEAKTVHRVQGQERKVVIISLVRSDRLGFLAGRQGRRILNVATSRAEENLVLVYSRGMRPPEVAEMEDRLARYYREDGLSFQVLKAFPSRLSTLASLRRAWGYSTGRGALDLFLDRAAAPIWETAVFLALLGVGLVYGDALLIAAGAAVKTVIFPALHAAPAWLGFGGEAVDAKAVAVFSSTAALLYVVGFFAVAAAGAPAAAAFWAAFVPPMILHWRFNRPAGTLSAADLGTAASLELDTVDGLAAQRTSRLANELAPPARRAPVFRFGHVRAVRSKA